MPLYYFDLWDGQRFHFDGSGIERNGPEYAFEEAIHGARRMLADAALKRQDVSGWAYQVRDEAGMPLFNVPFSLASVDQHYGRPGSMSGGSAKRRRKGAHLRR